MFFSRKEVAPEQSAKSPVAAFSRNESAAAAQDARPAFPPAQSALGPTRPEYVKPGDVESLPQLAGKIITAYGDVPRHRRVVTVGAKAVYSLDQQPIRPRSGPPPLEESCAALVAAIEVDVNTVVILTAEDAANEPRIYDLVLSTLHARLGGHDMRVAESGGTLSATRAVLLELGRAELKRQSGAASGMTKNKSPHLEMYDSWLEKAVREKANDLHIRQDSPTTGRVELRVDGELIPIPGPNNGVYPAETIREAISAAYQLALDAGSGTHSDYVFDRFQACMIPRQIAGKRLRIRYQQLKGHYGPKVVSRILFEDQPIEFSTFEGLGYAPSHVRMFRNLLRTPSGGVLICGVTGSGKSTSLVTLFSQMPRRDSFALFSIEDPVEYPQSYIHQIPHARDLMNREKSANEFGEIIGSLMRADPDAVSVGEIRDEITCKAFEQIVDSGHLGAATLHAHLLQGIASRLSHPEVGMSRQTIGGPNTFNLLAYQALVPLLCPHCKIPGAKAVEMPGADQESRSDVFTALTSRQRFGIEGERFFFRNTRGCEHCNGRGNKGQTVVSEMAVPDETWRRFTREGEDYRAWMHWRNQSDRDCLSQNMDGKTVFEHTLFKAAQGLVDPQQVERFYNVNYFEILRRID